MIPIEAEEGGSKGLWNARIAAFLMRYMLGTLAVWDAGWGLLALINPDIIQPPWLTPQAGDLGYIRAVGVFWLFMAYAQALAAFDLRRFILAAQLAVFLRLPTGLLNIYLVFVEYPSSEGAYAKIVLLFAIGDIAVWVLGALFLNRIGSSWLAWRRPSSTDVKF